MCLHRGRQVCQSRWHEVEQKRPTRNASLTAVGQHHTTVRQLIQLWSEAARVPDNALPPADIVAAEIICHHEDNVWGDGARKQR